MLFLLHDRTRAAVAVAVLMSLGAAPESMALRNIKVGDPIPAFSVQSLDGTSVNKGTSKGKVLLIVLARPKHDKSRQALRVAQRILTERDRAKFAVLGVSTKPGTEEYFKGLVSELGLTYPIAIDPGRKMYGALGVIVTPTTLLIDEDGILRFELPHMPPGYAHRLGVHTDLLLGKISRDEHDARLAQKRDARADGQDSWTSRLALAQALLGQQKPEQAIPILTKLHAEKDTVAVSTLIGTSLLDLNRTDEAAKYLDPLAARNTGSPRVTIALGRLEIERGNDQAAETYLRAALQASPDKGPILYYLGCLFERRGELPKAVDFYRRALEEAYGVPAAATGAAEAVDVATERTSQDSPPQRP